MKEICGTCAFWIYKGFEKEYEIDNGKGFEKEYEIDDGRCLKFYCIKKSNETCDKYVSHPCLLEN